jgi:hypothetical protein
METDKSQSSGNQNHMYATLLFRSSFTLSSVLPQTQTQTQDNRCQDGLCQS